MAHNPTFSATAKAAALDAALDVLHGGYMDFYGTVNGVGSGQPASPDVAITDQVKAVRLPLGNPAFAPTSGGQKVANAIGSVMITTSADVRWYRLVTSAEVAVHDGSVGTIDAGCDATVGTTTFLSGTMGACPSLVISIP